MRILIPSTCILFLLAVIAGSVIASPVFAAEGDLQPIPALSARITDLTGTLNTQQKQTLDDELATLESRKDAQLGVLIVATTQPEDIAQYAIRVFDQWKLGRKDIDDGALLIVAKDDHRVRIEVARGLEGAIPDAAAARIIREYITPKFRTGDFYGGIEDAVGILTKLIDGEQLPPPLTDDTATRTHGDLLSAAVIAFFIGTFVRGLLGRAPAPARSGVVALVTGGVAWFVSGALLVGLGLGLLGLLFGYMGGGGGGGFANRGDWGNWGSGGLGGGGWSGGGSGGFGGGGFSGGGGVSAGGGASGSW